MSVRGTILDESVKVACNWCGSPVLAYLARYLSGKGIFYHRECYDERRQLTRKERQDAQMLGLRPKSR